MLVDEHSVVDLRARRREQLRIGLDADAGHHEIAREHPALLRAHPLHAALALEGGDGILEHQLHTLLAVDVGEHRADLGPSTLASGTGCPSTAVTSTPIWRRDAVTSEPMKPSPTTTARRPARASARIRSQSSTVRSWKMPGRSPPEWRESVAPARGHEQPIVGNPLSALERDVLAAGIDGGGAHAEPEVDMALGVERGRVDQLILEAILAAQVALGERGPTVGHPRLGARSW